jgi:hypothetical protein
MRLSSIERITHALAHTLQRFPFETLAALVGSSAFYYTVIAEEVNKILFTKFSLTAALALVFYLSAGLYARSSGRGNRFYLSVQAGATVLLVLYYYSLPNYISDTHMQRYAILSAVGHLAVSFAPFLLHRNVNAFWHYNKTLFIRILTSGIYSMVLFGGLAGVLGSLDALFEIDIDYKTYVILGSFIYGVFNTLFFLSGIPEKPEHADENSTYPSGLSMFTQYVLIPLVSIYLFILFAYEIKILVTFSLPKGWIASLIIAFSIVGILANLLVYPLRENSDKGWVRFFAKWFYLLLMPLLVLFYWAVLYRVYQYGFTEERYYLFITAIWLTGISSYFVFSSSKNILYIPISLAVIGLFSIYAGPLSATSISLRSQLSRLEISLNDSAIHTDSDKQKQAISIMKYCMQTHGRSSIAPLLNERATQKVLEPDTTTGYRYVGNNECIELLKLQGIQYIEPNDVDEQKKLLNITHAEYNLSTEAPFRLAGEDFIVNIDKEHIIEVTFEEGAVWEIKPDMNIIQVTVNGRKVWTTDLRKFVATLDSIVANSQTPISQTTNETDEGFYRESYTLTQELLTLPVFFNGIEHGIIVFEQVVATKHRKDNVVHIASWKGKLLVKATQ